jgi:hypothetical protein
MIRNASSPLGDTFTWPLSESGALPTKNIGCRSMNARCSSEMDSYLPTDDLQLTNDAIAPTRVLN